MKRLLLILTVAVLASCSPEKKAEKLIKKWMSENLNDPKSYEPVSFSTLDSILTEFEDTPEAQKLLSYTKEQLAFIKKANQNLELADIWKGSYDSYSKSQFYSYIDLADKYMAKNDSVEKLKKEYEPIYDSAKEKFVPTLVGWEMSHKFRCKNGFGAQILSEKEFKFNKDLTEITDWSKE